MPAAVERKEVYLQRGTWRVSDMRCHLYASIKTHRVPRRIVRANDPSAAAWLRSVVLSHFIGDSTVVVLQRSRRSCVFIRYRRERPHARAAARAADGEREFWSARDLADVLGYTQWRSFEQAISRAIRACRTGDQSIPCVDRLIRLTGSKSVLRLPPPALGCKNGGTLLNAEREPLHLLHAADDLLNLTTGRHVSRPQEAQHRRQIDYVDPVGLAISHGPPVVTQPGKTALLAQRDGLTFTRAQFPWQRCGQCMLSRSQFQNRNLPCRDRGDQHFQIDPPTRARNL